MIHLVKMNKMAISLFLLIIIIVHPSHAEKSQSEKYDNQVSTYANVKEVVFRDDDTDVAGKAYDFTKAVLNWWNIPGQVLDTADFVRSVKNEGVNLSNTSTLLTKIAVNKVAIEKISESVKNMKPDQLKEIAEKLKISGAKGDMRKNVLELLTETAPKSGALYQEDERNKARNTLIIDIVTKLCKKCDVAHKSYKLAQEAARYADIVFDNTKTQSMFAKIKVAGFDDLKAFREEFVGGEALKDGARKALTLMHKSRGLSSPTDEEVMKYIFNRFQRWRIEIKHRKDEAEVLKAIKDEYMKLRDDQTDKMFGDVSEEQKISLFQKEYIELYNDIFSYKGDKPRPFGLGMKDLRWHIFQLLKKKQNGKLSSKEFEYEKRKLLASWGWLDSSKVGKPPIKYKPSEKQLAQISTRLQKLNYKKLMIVMDYMNVKLPDSFMTCLCRIKPAGTGVVGYIKTPRKDCPGPCTGGVISCVSWSPRADAEGWNICMGRVKMPNGTRIDEYIANKLPSKKKQLKSKLSNQQ